MKSYLLKIRGGVEVDSQGKKAGKGPLIQEEKSATLGVSQDQYLFQAIGFDSYNLDATGDVGRCLSTPSGGLNEHIPTVFQPISAGFKPAQGSKARDIGFEIEKCPTLNIATATAVLTFEPGIASREGGHIYEDVSGTLRAKPGDNQLAVCYEVEMEVAKRKYEVDIERLKELLRSHKTMSNKEIAERLDQPLTLVEHWFRADKYFAIPQPEIWMQLKALLGIETDEFDRSIMEFEFVGGNYDMRNRIWGGETAPTLTQGCDDYLLVPKCYGISSYDSNAMKSSNPHSGIYEAETSRTLDHNGNNPACNQGGIVVIENHPADSRVNIDDSGTVQTLTSRMGTGGGNVPLVMYSKQRRAKFKGDFETWHESKVTNTMNTFDQGDVRATDVVVCVGMVLDDITPKWSLGDKAFTTRGTDWKRDGALCVVLEGGQPTYCIGNGQVNDAAQMEKERCKTLNCMDDPMKILTPRRESNG